MVLLCRISAWIMRKILSWTWCRDLTCWWNNPKFLFTCCFIERYIKQHLPSSPIHTPSRIRSYLLWPETWTPGISECKWLCNVRHTRQLLIKKRKCVQEFLVYKLPIIRILLIRFYLLKQLCLNPMPISCRMRHRLFVGCNSTKDTFNILSCACTRWIISNRLQNPTCFHMRQSTNHQTGRTARNIFKFYIDILNFCMKSVRWP